MVEKPRAPPVTLAFTVSLVGIDIEANTKQATDITNIFTRTACKSGAKPIVGTRVVNCLDIQK